MNDERRARHGDARPVDEQEPIEELAEEVADATTDEQTRRETFELELMEEGRSEEGTDVELDATPRPASRSNTGVPSEPRRSAGSR